MSQNSLSFAFNLAIMMAYGRQYHHGGIRYDYTINLTCKLVWCWGKKKKISECKILLFYKL